MPPLTFVPHFRPQVWGGRRLQTVLGKSLPPEGRFGESWELSGQRLHSSQIAAGPLKGRPLNDLWNDSLRLTMPAPYRDSEEFPLLVKWLDCDELLSVQVHPNDAQAQQLLGEKRGKSEAWVVVHAEPTARVYAGFKAGVTRAIFDKHLENGSVADCLHSFVPARGDVVYIPAGTVHAAGGGIVMAEVQQTSDATFRLYDWDRPGPDGKPRQLHLREAMECINWSQGPVNPVCRLPIDGSNAGEHEPVGDVVLKTPYFQIRLLSIGTGLFLGRNAAILPAILMVIAGNVRYRPFAENFGQPSTVDQPMELPLGSTWLFPTRQEDFELSRMHGTPAACLLIELL